MLKRHRDRVSNVRRDPDIRVWVRVAALVAIAAFLVAFIIENSKPRPLHFVFATAQVSQDWLILLSVAIGIVIGVLASQLAHRRRQRRIQATAAPTSEARRETPSSTSSTATKL
ncbi:MAG: hypothetical protein QOH73_2385 [Gaiellaceae bacterium]|nr:hypothetical protein [Gaiellaceae bacterium]